MKSLGKFLLIVLIGGISAAVPAHSTTTVEVKHGTVVSVFNDQLVVKMANGEAKQVTVPSGFKFDVDGQEVGLEDLKPGTELTAVITSTAAPQVVKTKQIKNGEVVQVAGNQVWFRHEGKIKVYKVPAGFNLFVNGKKVNVADLSPGMKLTAEIAYTSEKTVSEKDIKISGKTPPTP